MGESVTDKLDLRVPRHAASLRRYDASMRCCGLRSTRRSITLGYVFNVRLNLYCPVDKAGNHKLEVTDVGQMTGTKILQEIRQVIDMDGRSLSISCE